jgi:hypothetical protein
LCHTLLAVTGITNKSLRALMTGLLGTSYSMNQASYDLARLRRHVKVGKALYSVPWRLIGAHVHARSCGTSCRSCTRVTSWPPTWRTGRGGPPTSSTIY